MPDTYYTKYLSMLQAIYSTLFASVLGGGAFLLASLYLQRDKKRVDDYLNDRGKIFTLIQIERQESWKKVIQNCQTRFDS